MTTLHAWGRLTTPHSPILSVHDRHAPLPAAATGPVLAHGCGRSYGDVCLNERGSLLHTLYLDHFIDFNPSTGILRAEAGVTLRSILALVVPHGWFLAVTPGTRDVTLGGAIANDVHGKNHHIAGSFGHHVRQLELLRSTGERFLCDPQQHSELFRATIGGLGLTGLITWAEIALIPIANPFMTVETNRFSHLEQFWLFNAQAETRWPYAVAWIDCLAPNTRGVLMAGNHAASQEQLPRWQDTHRSVPFNPPVSLVNGLSLRAFNTLYWHKARENTALQHYIPYFYPLDAVAHWNRIYGRGGFYQYQCVLPPEAMREGTATLLKIIARSGQGSFLAVLKTFGPHAAPGMLSFPRPGATLALDFPNHGQRTLDLFAELDAVVRDTGGAIYPAKDARMPAALFRSAFPQWEAFSHWIDPAFSSDFWHRVTS